VKQQPKQLASTRVHGGFIICQRGLDDQSLDGADEEDRRKAATAQAAGASRVIHAVNQYDRYFNHPGWKPLG
jgi:hypothetical protein